MDIGSALDRCAPVPTATLATIGPSGRPHLVPVVFAIAGDRVVTAIDEKPKRTTRLQRLANLEADPRATLLVHHYEEDWDRLWWVRLDCEARLVGMGDEHRTAVAALAGKYPQYRERPPTGTVIVLTVVRSAAWSAR